VKLADTHITDTINVGPTGFNGSTNSGGDHIVRDISQICRR
jgi:hypothetical protein